MLPKDLSSDDWMARWRQRRLDAQGPLNKAAAPPLVAHGHLQGLGCHTLRRLGSPQRCPRALPWERARAAILEALIPKASKLP